MGSSVHVHRVQYAVIEAHYSKAQSERLVVAYEEEKSLRAFIAAPRIIARGFSSENEAEEMLHAFDARQGVRRWLPQLAPGLTKVAGRLIRFPRSHSVGLRRELSWHSTCPRPT